jgi:hypothetical protein
VRERVSACRRNRGGVAAYERAGVFGALSRVHKSKLVEAIGRATPVRRERDPYADTPKHGYALSPRAKECFLGLCRLSIHRTA